MNILKLSRIYERRLSEVEAAANGDAVGINNFSHITANLLSPMSGIIALAGIVKTHREDEERRGKRGKREIRKKTKER